jgi:hypothetical protein
VLRSKIESENVGSKKEKFNRDMGRIAINAIDI